MKRIISLLLFVMIAAPVFAAVHTVEVTAKGRGSTRDKAIQDGLYLAVCQVQGVSVRSDVARVGVSTGSLDVTRDETKGTKKVEVEGVSADLAGTVTLTEARGLVKTFEVTGERQVSPDLYEVDLKVQVYDYQSPEDAKKLRLVVFPFESLAEVHRFGTTVIPGKRLGEQFSQYLSTMLARSEKFTILDRNSQEAILREKKILSSADAPLEEKARLGEVLGADYVLVGTIPQAALTVTEKPVAAVGGSVYEFKATVEVEYRLLVGPTQQIAFSNELKIDLEDAQVRALAPEWKWDDIDYGELEQRLVRLAAGRIADDVTEYLNPIRVAAVRDDGTVILNQGGRRFAPGDIFEVSRGGADVIDPDTGRSLGKDEVSAGAIRITKVLPRIAYAEVVEGASVGSMMGGVCRRAKADYSVPVPGGRGSGVQETGSGGVKLPFDDRGRSTTTRER